MRAKKWGELKAKIKRLRSNLSKIEHVVVVGIRTILKMPNSNYFYFFNSIFLASKSFRALILLIVPGISEMWMINSLLK